MPTLNALYPLSSLEESQKIQFDWAKFFSHSIPFAHLRLCTGYGIRPSLSCWGFPWYGRALRGHRASVANFYATFSHSPWAECVLGVLLEHVRSREERKSVHSVLCSDCPYLVPLGLLPTGTC